MPAPSGVPRFHVGARQPMRTVVEAIRARQVQGDIIFDETHVVHADRGVLLAEVDRLRAALEQIRVHADESEIQFHSSAETHEALATIVTWARAALEGT